MGQFRDCAQNFILSSQQNLDFVDFLMNPLHSTQQKLYFVELNMCQPTPPPLSLAFYNITVIILFPEKHPLYTKKKTPCRRLLSSAKKAKYFIFNVFHMRQQKIHWYLLHWCIPNRLREIPRPSLRLWMGPYVRVVEKWWRLPAPDY